MINFCRFSEDRQYRYMWEHFLPERSNDRPLIACMLNPSVANETQSDSTITCVIKRAPARNCGRIIVLNLFALVSPDPQKLYKHVAPVGPLNDATIKEILQTHAGNADVLVAWGIHGGFLERDRTVLDAIYRAGYAPYALPLTGDGFPRHPRRVAYNAELVPYRGRFAR